MWVVCERNCAMELKSKDTYRTYLSRDLSATDLDALMTLYQPLVGGDAILVYLTLASESRNTMQMNHARLFRLMNEIQLDTFLHAKARLEEYMLLRTFVKEGETRNTYMYMLISPLNAKDFLATSLYASRFMRTAGKKTYDENMSRFAYSFVKTDGYKEVTAAMKNVKEEDYDNAITYKPIQPRFRFQDDDTTINFDYDHFIATTSTSVFPSELRTQENMSYIGKLATLYGLSADRMRINVAHSISLKHMTLDRERLKFLCENGKPDITKAKDPYTLPPVSFLMGKQNGASVTLTDKKILERLAMDMHFSPVVINIMIEYILKVSDNRLNPRFVDMVASEWARDGIETREQALLETKKTITKTNHKYTKPVQISTPEYFKVPTTKQPEQPNEQLLAQIKAMQAKMGGEK